MAKIAVNTCLYFKLRTIRPTGEGKAPRAPNAILELIFRLRTFEVGCGTTSTLELRSRRAGGATSNFKLRTLNFKVGGARGGKGSGGGEKANFEPRTSRSGEKEKEGKEGRLRTLNFEVGEGGGGVRWTL